MMNKYGVLSVGVITIGVLALQGCGTQEQVGIQKTPENNSVRENNNMRGNNVDSAMYGDAETHASIDGIPLAELSANEITDILYMREEEKLARDVYMALGEKWGQNVFMNIQQSEQLHMDEIKILIDRYELTDPVVTDVPGTFTSTELQKLYDALIVKGNTSLAEALIVGATIEDLDIKDLQDATMRTDNEDVQVIYANLMGGSKKHLQSFVKNIEKQGGTYTPQYITQTDYNEFISMDRVTGGKSDGKTCAGNGAGCTGNDDGTCDGTGCELRDGSGGGNGRGNGTGMDNAGN